MTKPEYEISEHLLAWAILAAVVLLMLTWLD